jgi:hypothetical protein
MPNEVKGRFLREIETRYGPLRKLEASQSLFELGSGAARLYVRYSKIHDRKQAFYGLRKKDLQQLEGHPSVLCFLWDDQKDPLFIPFSDYEELFRTLNPAEDGQYKVMVYLQIDSCEFYVAGVGRFNADAYVGWNEFESTIDRSKLSVPVDLTHSQIQTLLGALGAKKDFDVWLPANNRVKMDWSVASRFKPHTVFPLGFKNVETVMQEIDVIWLQRGSGEPKAFFEIEHSTPIYSGLLRFNDVRIIAPRLEARFSIVAHE